MLSFTGSLKVFLALEPCDLRKGFNGLQTVVSETLQQEAHAIEGALLGRKRAVAADEAPGKGNLQLAP
jgi:hypothetical protein